MKDFITHQIEKQSLSFTAESFLGLSDTENSLVLVEIPLADYTLTEIARIVESNNARVMNLFVLPVADGNTLILSIKLNLLDVSPLLMSLERFNYKVLHYEMKEGSVTDTHKERLDELLYYLSM
ncbi:MULTISPECIES: hypothetical protein [Petrimonas]|jgi:hypothetical protein|uniref:CBS domain-containing protein n=1 Tax=Petrimonas mucosa TaxID=1642646 RepID=A0A1G4G5T5_9BACT|nr:MULTISPECIES: hypothetical protein [Petrimonas]MDD3560298.1 hypothetical protein [Petrimonas mucosa]SCM56767.1 putative protein {ECO:0000313/EMBL:CEA16321,1} [Petrimonas mucosa]SFU37954.1 hypothetical protein SAMN05216364_100715 [Porphyromonadaceae bacterium KHP3R9]HHT29491.1 hypothetical protein [Petrimonas mucosa]